MRMRRVPGRAGCLQIDRCDLNWSSWNACGGGLRSNSDFSSRPASMISLLRSTLRSCQINLARRLVNCTGVCTSHVVSVSWYLVFSNMGCIEPYKVYCGRGNGTSLICGWSPCRVASVDEQPLHSLSPWFYPLRVRLRRECITPNPEEAICYTCE